MLKINDYDYTSISSLDNLGFNINIYPHIAAIVNDVFSRYDKLAKSYSESEADWPRFSHANLLDNEVIFIKKELKVEDITEVVPLLINRTTKAIFFTEDIIPEDSYLNKVFGFEYNLTPGINTIFIKDTDIEKFDQEKFLRMVFDATSYNIDNVLKLNGLKGLFIDGNYVLLSRLSMNDCELFAFYYGCMYANLIRFSSKFDVNYILSHPEFLPFNQDEDFESDRKDIINAIYGYAESMVEYKELNENSSAHSNITGLGNAIVKRKYYDAVELLYNRYGTFDNGSGVYNDEEE